MKEDKLEADAYESDRCHIVYTKEDNYSMFHVSSQTEWAVYSFECVTAPCAYLKGAQ